MANPKIASLDENLRFPEDVVERFVEDNIPPADVDEVGVPRMVVLEHDTSSDDVPDGTLIVRLPEGFTT